ncbi:MAG TPA: S16 family serine protease [Methanomicrobiales archaeon]|nr:S16 family serine protease [Methanomicrobiales archaeon]
MKNKTFTVLLMLLLTVSMPVVAAAQMDNGTMQQGSMNQTGSLSNTTMFAGVPGMNTTTYEPLGSATFQAPVVIEISSKVEETPYVKSATAEVGDIVNISVDIVPGKGRVLVETTPITGVVFQDAAKTAAFVAVNKSGADLSHRDIIYSESGDGAVSTIEGPSAGGVMTLLALAVINNYTLADNVTATGTIYPDGSIGAIGGVLEKAQAAENVGDTLFLLPKANSRLIQFNEEATSMDGVATVRQRPVTVDAKEYIESTIGIRVEYIETIDDLVRYATLPAANTTPVMTPVANVTSG